MAATHNTIKWTEEEEALLRELYPIHGPKKLSEMGVLSPGRSATSIQIRARKLGVRCDTDAVRARKIKKQGERLDGKMRKFGPDGVPTNQRGPEYWHWDSMRKAMMHDERIKGFLYGQ